MNIIFNPWTIILNIVIYLSPWRFFVTKYILKVNIVRELKCSWKNVHEFENGREFEMAQILKKKSWKNIHQFEDYSWKGIFKKKVHEQMLMNLKTVREFEMSWITKKGSRKNVHQFENGSWTFS